MDGGVEGFPVRCETLLEHIWQEEKWDPGVLSVYDYTWLDHHQKRAFLKKWPESKVQHDKNDFGSGFCGNTI